jgi:hypothetical protein
MLESMLTGLPAAAPPGVAERYREVLGRYVAPGSAGSAGSAGSGEPAEPGPAGGASGRRAPR